MQACLTAQHLLLLTGHHQSHQSVRAILWDEKKRPLGKVQLIKCAVPGTWAVLTQVSWVDPVQYSSMPFGTVPTAQRPGEKRYSNLGRYRKDTGTQTLPSPPPEKKPKTTKHQNKQMIGKQLFSAFEGCVHQHGFYYEASAGLSIYFFRWCISQEQKGG